MDYKITVQGEEKGPYSLSQLQSMWGSGTITSDSLYWHTEAEDWKTIKELIEPSLSPTLDEPSPPVLNEPTSPEEKKLFDKGDIFVSNHRLILNGQTFAIRNIASVHVEVQTIPKSTVSLWFGLTFLFSGLIIFLAVWYIAIPIVIFGVYLIYIYIKNKDKHIYWLCLTTNAGATRVKGWYDQNFTQEIANAINQAMMYG